MATKEKETVEVEELVSRSELFIENNSKKIIFGILAIAVIVGAFLGYQHGYVAPQQKKAAAAMFKGEQYFARDSFQLALNGNGADYEGFAAIADEYGFTDAGNLAKAYAGICYFKLGDNDKAIDMLKSFSANDQMVSPAIVGLIGDCYVNAGNVKEGISYFEKAAKSADKVLLMNHCSNMQMQLNRTHRLKRNILTLWKLPISINISLVQLPWQNNIYR